MECIRVVKDSIESEYSGCAMDNYDMIFKRKSFHLFRKREMIAASELDELNAFIATVRPLDDSIGFMAKVVPESETSCRRGAQYCIELYSEEKGNYLRNVGYIGEQIDLWLASKNIGALWFGIGKPDEKCENGLKFVIMIAIAKMPRDAFRKDMFKAKRKPLEEIWEGDTLSVAEIVRFTPSACNTQPWYIVNAGKVLEVYRYKKPGKRGIMPADKVRFYNRIDIGILLLMLETCLRHERYEFESKQFFEDEPDAVERVLVARYEIKVDAN